LICIQNRIDLEILDKDMNHNIRTKISMSCWYKES